MSATVDRSVLLTSVTPSGIEVQYQAEPKRLYRVYDPSCPEKGRVEVPSVTTVLEVLDKPALPWWGMTTGIEGTLALLNRGLISVEYIDGNQPLAVVKDANGWTVAAGKENVVALLTQEKLTVNHVRDRAGVRGVGVHDALEAWADNGAIPDPSIFPPEEQGYVLGLVAFLNDVPTAKAVASEVMVGSVEHGYAGRYDLVIETEKPHTVVFKRTPKRGPQHAEIPAGRFLLDLKTSSGVYSSHFRQLAAYEQASVECGYQPTDAQGVIHVNPDGTYELVRSHATFDDFRVVLEVYRSNERMKERS